MQQNSFLEFIHTLSDWFVKLIVINLFWFLFSLLGLFVLGFFPATVAMYSVIRKMVLGERENIQVFKLFFSTYKKDFIKSNLVGFILLVIGIFLYIDVKLLSVMTGFASQF